VTERTGTYNEVKVERERRMTAVEGKQARQRATLGAEIDSDYAETLAEADRTVNSAVETVNAELDAWRETVTAGVYSKTVTRSETDRTVIGETTKTGESAPSLCRRRLSSSCAHGLQAATLPSWCGTPSTATRLLTRCSTDGFTFLVDLHHEHVRG